LRGSLVFRAHTTPLQSLKGLCVALSFVIRLRVPSL